MRPITRSATVLAIAALFVAAVPALAANRPWPAQPLTTDHVTGFTANHEMTSDGPHVYMTYVSEATPLAGDLLFRRSDDGGRTWTQPATLFSTGTKFTELAGNLAIVASADLVVIAFRARDATTAYLYTVASHDGGQTWDPRVRVARTTTPLRNGIPSMTITSAGVLVAWTDRTTGRISTRLSTDGAVSYRPPTLIATTRHSFACGDPNYTEGLVAVEADGNHAYLAWTSDAVAGCDPTREFLRRSTDGGRTWLPRQLLPGTAGTTGWPEIAAHGRQVALFLPAPTTGNLLLYSDDAGRSFSGRTFVAATSAQLTTPGDVAYGADGSLRIVYSEYQQAADGLSFISSDLASRVSNDGGVTFGAPSLVASAAHGGAVGSPNLALPGGTPVVAFNASDATGTTVDIWVARLAGPRFP